MINEIHEIYRHERQWVPLSFFFKARENQRLLLSVSDGKRVRVSRKKPQRAINRPTDESSIEASLSKLEGHVIT